MSPLGDANPSRKLDVREKMKLAWQRRKASGKGSAWNKGLKTGPLSDDHRKNMSEAHEQIPNIGRFKKGDTPRLGILHTQATRKKLSLSHLGIKGELIGNWKGDNVGYAGLHDWVERWRGKPTDCEKCGIVPSLAKDGRQRVHWANKSHQYKRELSDWLRLCVKCHKAYDLGRITIN